MIVTDDFNRADSADLGANWTQERFNWPAISSNQAVGSSDVGQSGAYWSANSFGDPQFSRCRITAMVDGYVALSVRVNGGGVTPNGYRAQYDIPNQRVLVDRMPFIEIANFPAALAVGDTIEFQAVGARLRALVNAVVVGEIYATEWPSGTVGLQIFKTTSALDDWSGGDLQVPEVGLSWLSGYAVSGARGRGMIPSGMVND